MVGGVGFECCILLGFWMCLVVAVSGFSGCVVLVVRLVVDFVCCSCF